MSLCSFSFARQKGDGKGLFGVVAAPVSGIPASKGIDADSNSFPKGDPASRPGLRRRLGGPGKNRHWPGRSALPGRLSGRRYGRGAATLHLGADHWPLPRAGQPGGRGSLRRSAGLRQRRVALRAGVQTAIGAYRPGPPLFHLPRRAGHRCETSGPRRQRRGQDPESAEGGRRGQRLALAALGISCSSWRQASSGSRSLIPTGSTWCWPSRSWGMRRTRAFLRSILS